MIWLQLAKRMYYACQDRYGDIFSIRLALQPTMVMLADPVDVKQVFTGDPKVFHAGEGNDGISPLVGEKSLLTLDEQPHLGHRKLLLPSFHGERLRGYEQVMSELAIREIETWPTQAPCELRTRMQTLTMEIIMRTIFGMREGRDPRMGVLRTALRDFLDLAGNPAAFLLVALRPKLLRQVPPFRGRLERLDALIQREIAERRDADDLAERDDVLSMMAEARHEDGSPMSTIEIRDELVTLLVAGHETTATALAWAAERLVQHPDKLERLRAEVEEGREEYLTATIQETLRLRPPLSQTLRRITEPVEIGGYELPAGVVVSPSAYLVHRNPEIYPEPERFLPERFLETPPGTYTWIPFGGGVRRCLGAAFAQLEMKVVLRELLKRRQIHSARGRPERILRRGIVETPRHGGEVVLS